MKVRKQYKKHRIEISGRPHGNYCYFILKNGGVVYGNGYHGTSVPTIEFATKQAKEWIDKNFLA